MKHSINYRLPSPTFLLVVCFALISTVTSACKSGELSRTQAAEMIAASPGYKSPATVPTKQTALDNGDPTSIEVTGDDDTPEKAVERATIQYADDSPQFAVANRLGIVVPNLVARETILPKKSLTGDPWLWYLDANPVLNDKGKKLWTDYGLPANETAIPVALRGAPEVTGMIKQGDTEMAVDYKYKFVPNEVGKFIDPSTPEFKSLPPDMQDCIQGKFNKFGQPRERIDASWDAERMGHAVFRKYDDGWRLIGAR